MSEISIRPAGDSDRAWIASLITGHWGSEKVITRGVVHHTSRLPGLVAMAGERRIGLLTYRMDAGECEIVTLNSLKESRGIGSALLDAVARIARDSKAGRLWLITTNDNLPAQRFYLRRGFTLVRIYEGAIEKSRLLKPEIPLTGIGGVEIRDEIEFELML